MADVLSQSSLSISSIGTLSGFLSHTIPVTALEFSDLSYTNPNNTRQIVFRTIANAGYYNNVGDNSVFSFASKWPPGSDYSPGYSATPLSAYGWSPITVGVNIAANSTIAIIQSAYFDENYTLWMNINNQKNNSGLLVCYPIANITDPQGPGAHTRIGYATYDLSVHSLTAGSILNFFIGAGKNYEDASNGYYWINGYCRASFTYTTALTTEHAPIRLSDYYYQDFDVPQRGSPIRFSDFSGAVNYPQNTLLSFYNFSQNYNKTLGYIGAGGRIFSYGGSSAYLGDINAKSIIRTKHSLPTSVTNSTGLSSDTFAMLNASLVIHNEEFSNGINSIFFQKNNNTASTISTNYTETQINIVNMTLRQALDIFGLASMAPQVLSEIGLTTNQLDTFTFNSSNKNITDLKLIFGSNTSSIVSRLITISNQTNPQVQYTLASSLSIFNTSSINISKRIYTDVICPLCYNTSVGNVATTISLSGLTDIHFGDAYNIYAGMPAGQKTTSLHLDLQNTLILNFP